MKKIIKILIINNKIYIKIHQKYPNPLSMIKIIKHHNNNILIIIIAPKIISPIAL
jgi:hypothetical protein